MVSRAARKAIRASYPPTPGYGVKPAEDRAFEVFAIRLARYNAYEFFKRLISLYNRNKKALTEALGTGAQAGHLLGVMGHKLERKCAADTDFTSPQHLAAYKAHIIEVRAGIRSISRDSDENNVRGFVHNLLTYDAAPFKVHTDHPDSTAMERADSVMRDNPTPAERGEDPPATSSEVPSVNTDMADVPSSSAPEERQDSEMEDAPAVAGAAEDTQAPVSSMDIEMQDRSAPVLKFVYREWLDEVDDAVRQSLLEQIFSVLKQERDGWTDRHGPLEGIHDVLLAQWATEMEDAVARAADDNLPDPETLIPSAFTDREVYFREKAKLEKEMQDPLAFFKNKIRRYMEEMQEAIKAGEVKQITFVEDDKPEVESKFCIERNLPPCPSALRNRTFQPGVKRVAHAAFGFGLSTSAPKRNCLPPAQDDEIPGNVAE